MECVPLNNMPQSPPREVACHDASLYRHCDFVITVHRVEVRWRVVFLCTLCQALEAGVDRRKRVVIHREDWQ